MNAQYPRGWLIGASRTSVLRSLLALTLVLATAYCASVIYRTRPTQIIASLLRLENAELTPKAMKIHVHLLAAGVLLTLPSCSKENDRIPAEVWVTASSLDPPNVAYSPAPIITARERDDGTWIWHPQRAAAETIPPQMLLRKVAEAKSLRPEPLILFSFAHRAEQSALAELKARIANAADCSSLTPCVEGTPEQLR